MFGIFFFFDSLYKLAFLQAQGKSPDESSPETCIEDAKCFFNTDYSVGCGGAKVDVVFL